jgi:sRNA-binding carbon storage regulator CsrA
MLVISRTSEQTVIVYDKQTMLLTMVVVVLKRSSGRLRLGFHVPPSIGIIRTELTAFKDMPYGKLITLPIGTKVEIVGSSNTILESSSAAG